MTRKATPVKKMDFQELVEGIAHDTSELIGQQTELLRTEVAQEFNRAGEAAVLIAAGGGLTAASGLLTGMMVAHLLHRTVGLPLWLCYGAVGGGIGAAGVGLLQAGRAEVAKVELIPPPETAKALQENAAWLKRQVLPEKA